MLEQKVKREKCAVVSTSIELNECSTKTRWIENESESLGLAVDKCLRLNIEKHLNEFFTLTKSRVQWDFYSARRILLNSFLPQIRYSKGICRCCYWVYHFQSHWAQINWLLCMFWKHLRKKRFLCFVSRH